MHDNQIWTDSNYESVFDSLKQKSNLKYLEFSKKIINTKYKMLGVSIPEIKTIFKTIKKTDLESFLILPKNNYYEEILLESFVLGSIKDIKIFEKHFNKYINKIDCWSLCDTACSNFKIVKQNRKYFLRIIKKLITSKKEYKVRVGVVLLLDYYIDDQYIDEIFNIVDSINREEYYINMAIAWLLSICYIKQKDKTLSYLKKAKINDFTYNKTISKICDSKQVGKEEKEFLKKPKRKNKGLF